MSKLSNYNMFFYLPFFYFFKTRLLGKVEKISWFFIYILPIFIMVFWGRDFSYHNLFYLVVYIFAVYTTYEVGYIWNDSETIKNEINPTKRLSEIELSYYERKKTLIYTYRGLFVLFFIFLLPNSINILLFINVLIICVLYFLYNTNRNLFNLPLHFLLVCSRFVFPVCVFSSISFLWVITIFPIVNLLERAAEKRFGLTLFQNFILSNKKRGRYVYYFIITTLLYFLNAPEQVVITALYMFLYRFFSFELKKLVTER